MDTIKYVCHLCNRDEQIPKDVVHYFDLMDDGDPTVPPRFSCKYCGGVMNPVEKWDFEGSAEALYEGNGNGKNFSFLKTEKIGRNDPCPCGSGKKYKRCCAQK